MLPMTLLLIKEAAAWRRGGGVALTGGSCGAVREGWDDAGVARRRHDSGGGGVHFSS